MKKRIPLIAGAAGAGLFSLSGLLARYAVHGARYSKDEVLEKDLEDYPYLKDYAMLGPSLEGTAQYTVESADGIPLKVNYYAGEEGSRKFLILVHGYTMNRWSMLKYAPIYMDMGYHCITYDHRGHGENPHDEICTFGTREARDLIKIIEDTYRRFGEDIWLGLHGESLGGGTEITALQYHPNVRFIVDDCGFSEITNVMKDGLTGLKLPRFLFYPSSAASKVIYGESFFKMRPIDSLEDNTVPICFIHGEADTFIKPANSVQMWKKTRGYAELHLFPGAGHARSLYTDPEKYRKIVTDFVKKIENAEGETGE